MFVLQTLFPIICSMSLIGGIVIILVLLVRLPFRRLPKIFSYLLWSVVLLRLLCPFTFSSHLSVFQVIGTPLIQQNQNIDLGYTTNSDYLGNAQKPRESASLQEQENQGYLQGLEPREMVSEKWLSGTENAIEHTRVKIEDADITGKYTGILQAFWKIGGIVWLIGAAALWIYSIVSIVLLQRQLVGAVREDKNIYLCDYIGTAFVWGIVHPRIYLPTTLAKTEWEYILLHEKTHIRRGDHIFRLLAFAALSIHWFNPLVWCAFFLSERDMEMACDEAVIRRMGKDFRAAYSASLLTVASGRRIFAGAPLGFGEGNVKRRIQNIMRYKKTAAFTAVLLLALVAVVCIMLGSNPTSNEENTGREDNNEAETNKEIELQSGTNPIESKERELADTAEQIPITAPVITADMMLGADGPSLDYVDEYTLIFHDYFGLFVFDMWENEVIGAVDLSAIGCQQTQGDNYCEVQVSQEGKMVYLHPLNREDMYIYDVRDKMLTRQNYNYYNMEGIELFDKIKQTADCVNPDYTVWRSFGCVPLSGGRYVYLENGSGAVEDLFYIVEQADKQVKSAMIFEKYIDRKTDAQNALGYGDYTGYLETCAKWSGYEEFVDQDYDGDGKIDHVYRENIVDFESCRYRIEFGNGDLLETMQAITIYAPTAG